MNIQTILLAGLTLTALTLTVYYNTNQNQKSYHKEFLMFKQQYNKQHDSLQEMEYRYSIFVNNLQRIKAHNKTDSSYKLGINQYTDLTWKEFQKGYLAKQRINKSFNPKGEIKIDVEPIDWRKHGAVTPVKDQKSCGSCWAFSTTGSLEGYIHITTKELPSLSEQELVDCSRGYANDGCEGGLPSYAYNYIVDHDIGIEKDYPYQGWDNICQEDQQKGDRYSVDQYQIMTDPNVDNLSKLLKRGPVSVALEVTTDFQLYESGVFPFDDTCGASINHAVLLVGQAQNYYIVKNSWGLSWGEQGYIRLEIGSGSGNCGIANEYDVLPGHRI